MQKNDNVTSLEDYQSVIQKEKPAGELGNQDAPSLISSVTTKDASSVGYEDVLDEDEKTNQIAGDNKV